MALVNKNTSKLTYYQNMISIVVLSVVLGCNAITIKEERRFPDDFLFSTATASYQIEGAWNENGKSENIWDYLTHNSPHLIKDGSSGDIAADTYHNYKRDVEMMRELGLDAYRFSLSWSRILPTGFANVINEDGIAFYNNFINEMLKYNITPMVTLYHWDLPQKLQDLGGFMNPLISDWFEDYARVAYEHFGDRVKLWLTFNEPSNTCFYGYGRDAQHGLAPGLNATGIGEYLCAKHLVMAHAKAYHAYNNDFKPIQGGECGITLFISWNSPATDSDEDKMATELLNQAEWGKYAEPIFSEQGGFPKELVETVAEKSAKQGYSRSRLPDFTEEEKTFVKGTSDFFGVNHYTSFLVSASEYKGDYAVPSMYDDIDVGYYAPEEWPRVKLTGMAMGPKGLYNMLKVVSEKYNYPVIYITENGLATSTEDGVNDDERCNFYKTALKDVLDAIENGIRVKGYMAWSLMDNFEWMQGYTQRYGLYFVDFEDPARTRIPKKSAFMYKQMIKTRVIDEDYQPETSVMMTIDEGH